MAGRFLREAPDLVVEVVSRSTAIFDRHVKFSAYPCTAVREAWLVDMESRQVTVFVAQGESWETRPEAPFGSAIPSALLPDVGAAGLTA